jgi:hypothetical protein
VSTVHDPWFLALLVVAGVALLLAFAVAWLYLRPSVRSRGRNLRAQAGERRAEKVLARRGFVVVERQARRSWRLRIDGEEFQTELRADLLVRKDGLLYVAEVKTGRIAVDPAFPATRRQLLEYFLAFSPDGLLLVDPEAESVVEVGFPDLEDED